MADRANGEPRKKLRRVARALISGDAGGASEEQDQALAAFGLKREAPLEPQHVDCWPDNWLPLQVFAALGTQWNVGMNGVIGLRYEAIPIVLSEFGIKKKQRAEMMQSLRIMENEALQELRHGL